MQQIIAECELLPLIDEPDAQLHFIRAVRVRFPLKNLRRNVEVSAARGRRSTPRGWKAIHFMDVCVGGGGGGATTT